MSNAEDSSVAGQPLSPRDEIDRRAFIGTGSTALITAALLLSQARGQDIESVTRAQQDASASDAGPENVPVRDASPNAFVPPATDHGEVQTVWNTFSSAHRRI